jgi:hypothetical protein
MTGSLSSSTRMPHRRPKLGQGALTGALPFFFIIQRERVHHNVSLHTFMGVSRREGRGLDFRQGSMGTLSVHREGARHRGRRNDFGRSCGTDREDCPVPSQRLSIEWCGVLTSSAPFFLLPIVKWIDRACCAWCCFVVVVCSWIVPHSKCRNQLAAELIPRFIERMIRVSISDSKLCADKPRHAQVRRLSAICLRSTWQEEGSALPVASPPQCRKRQAETLPVSNYSGLRGAAALRSWAVCP